MNVSTGEIKRFGPDEKIPEGFIRLNAAEDSEAQALMGDNVSVVLPENHPLRKQIAERFAASNRPSPKAKRRAAKASRRGNRV
jgi:hypothetical protein